MEVLFDTRKLKNLLINNLKLYKHPQSGKHYLFYVFNILNNLERVFDSVQS